jgi:hypothetical protein
VETPVYGFFLRPFCFFFSSCHFVDPLARTNLPEIIITQLLVTTSRSWIRRRTFPKSPCIGSAGLPLFFKLHHQGITQTPQSLVILRYSIQGLVLDTVSFLDLSCCVTSHKHSCWSIRIAPPIPCLRSLETFSTNSNVVLWLSSCATSLSFGYETSIPSSSDDIIAVASGRSGTIWCNQEGEAQLNGINLKGLPKDYRVFLASSNDGSPAPRKIFHTPFLFPASFDETKEENAATSGHLPLFSSPSPANQISPNERLLRLWSRCRC